MTASDSSSASMANRAARSESWLEVPRPRCAIEVEGRSTRLAASAVETARTKLFIPAPGEIVAVCVGGAIRANIVPEPNEPSAMDTRFGRVQLLPGLDEIREVGEHDLAAVAERDERLDHRRLDGRDAVRGGDVGRIDVEG